MAIMRLSCGGSAEMPSRSLERRTLGPAPSLHLILRNQNRHVRNHGLFLALDEQHLKFMEPGLDLAEARTRALKHTDLAVACLYVLFILSGDFLEEFLAWP